MATKKAVSKRLSPEMQRAKNKLRAGLDHLAKKKTQVVTITADQFLAAVNRFGTVCDYVERNMRQEQAEYHEKALAQERTSFGQAVAPAGTPPKAVGVEPMAYEMRCLAQEVQKQAESIRLHLTTGAAATVEGANPGASPTMGPIKDCMDGTVNLLYSIRRDLDVIAQYTIGQ